MTNIFSVLEKNKNNTADNVLKDTTINAFKCTNRIYEIINNKEKNYEEQLDKMFKYATDNDLNFIVWILNHYLAYNEITRKNPDMFTGMFILFKSKEYIKFYTKFMIDNNLFFPRYMSWYSFNIENEHKKYIQYLKDNINMGDDEIQELLAYCNDKQISIKDICYNINTINEGEILNGS